MTRRVTRRTTATPPGITAAAAGTATSAPAPTATTAGTRPSVTRAAGTVQFHADVRCLPLVDTEVKSETAELNIPCPQVKKKSKMNEK